MKEKITFKNGSRLCFTVKEINLSDFYKKAIEINNSKDTDESSLIELRLDYLINKKYDIMHIIETINRLKLETKDRQYIATLRNFNQGGNCLITEKEYFTIIDALYEKSKVDGIDVDYDMYQKSRKYDNLFNGKKTFILSFISMDQIFSREEYISLYKKMSKSNAYIMKIVTRAFSFDDVKNLMETTRDLKDFFEENKKVPVAISTGRLGITSRVKYDFSDTKIIYLDAYDFNPIPLGEIDKYHFDKCRKLIK